MINIQGNLIMVNAEDANISTFAELEEAINNANSDTTIILDASFTISESLIITKNITLSSSSNDVVLTRDSSFISGPLFIVNEGARLTIDGNVELNNGNGSGQSLIDYEVPSITVEINKSWTTTIPDVLVEVDIYKTDYLNNKEILTTVTLSAINNWAIQLNGLDANYTYTAEEHTVMGYSAEYQTVTDSKKTTITIINSEISMESYAVDKVTGNRQIDPKGIVIIVDTVSYTNLDTSKTYTIKGILMDYQTKKELRRADGSFIEGTTSFSPATPNGSVDVEFTFDATGYDGRTIAVVEDLYLDNVLMLKHKDYYDYYQTIDFYGISTTATDGITGEKTLLAGGEVIVSDCLEYNNFTPGTTYTIKGVLMDKDTGLPLIVDGQKVETTTSFTPTSPSGTIQLDFPFNSDDMHGKSVVVYEQIYIGSQLVAVHEDIENKSQTVSFYPKTITVTPASPPDVPQIGTTDSLLGYSVLLMISISGIYLSSRKKDRKSEV